MASIRKRQGRYHAQVRRKGHPSVTRTFASKTSATKWVKAVETDMERGEFKPQVNMTVDELIKRYQKEIVPQHKGASSDVSRSRTIRRLLGKVNLADLTPAVLASYRDQRLKVILPSSLKRELTILSSAINTAIIDWGIPIHSNPVSLTRIPKFDDRRDRRLKDGEEERLLTVADSECQRIIIIAIETAMRRGEILRVRKSHIDFGKCILVIPETKTGKPRTIPLSTRAVKVLREQIKLSSDSKVVQIERDPVLFQIHVATFRDKWVKIRNAARCDDLRFHDLRRECTSRLFSRGFGIMEVASITGHEDLKMLKRYTHIKPESLVARLG